MHNVLRITAVGVVADAAVLVGADLILIDYPIKRGAIAHHAQDALTTLLARRPIY